MTNEAPYVLREGDKTNENEESSKYKYYAIDVRVDFFSFFLSALLGALCRWVMLDFIAGID